MNKFKNEFLEMWIEDDILYCSYFDNVIVNLKVAQQAQEDRLKFQGGKNYPCYIDVRKAKYWTQEARVFQATEYNNQGLKAIALHYDSAFQKTIIQFYTTFNKPNIPTQWFTSRETALQWLRELNTPGASAFRV